MHIDKKINCMFPINTLGYGVAGLNIFKELIKNVHASLFCIGNPEIYNKDDHDAVLFGMQNAQLFEYNAPCIKIWHQHGMAEFIGRGERIGFPFFELDEFSKIEKHHLKSLDKIFVTSKWAKNICINQLNVDDKIVHVVPLGVDINIFQPNILNDEEQEKTIFFNCGKWEIRKGHDVLCDIFCSAFDKDDNVELWMMCDNPFLDKEESDKWKSLYLESKLGDKIKFINRVKSHNEVYNIMQKIDCGVFPSRAEGWNLELLEVLACGKHVITTNYSAHTEFCDNNNSHLVDIQCTEKAYDGKWFLGNHGNWAKISQKEIDLFVDYMRSVHKNKKCINFAGIATGNTFTWEDTAKKVLEYV